MSLRPYAPGDRRPLEALLARRAERDGREGLSEHKSLRIGGDVVDWVAVGERDLAGYVQAAHHRAGDPDDAGHWAIETVVDPSADDEVSVAGALVAAVLQVLPDDAAVTYWAWRGTETTLAEHAGWSRIRALHQMHRPLPVDAAARPPGGTVLRSFRVGVDEDAWLAANNAAFAHHPENAALDRDDLAQRMAQEWFDPDGFLLLWGDEELLGYCWTKMHPGSVGEIYIIGVVPSAQGRGLGTVLVMAGLDDLARRQGAVEATLYVGAHESGALALYRKLGFEVAFTNNEYRVRGTGRSD